MFGHELGGCFYPLQFCHHRFVVLALRHKPGLRVFFADRLQRVTLGRDSEIYSLWGIRLLREPVAEFFELYYDKLDVVPRTLHRLGTDGQSVVAIGFFADRKPQLREVLPNFTALSGQISIKKDSRHTTRIYGGAVCSRVPDGNLGNIE